MTIISSVLIKPIVTEKTTGQKNKYTFIVSNEASKPDISSAVKEFFNVKKVISVNVSILPSKTKLTKFGKTQKRSKQKKAVVTLAEGETINFNDFK